MSVIVLFLLNVSDINVLAFRNVEPSIRLTQNLKHSTFCEAYAHSRERKQSTRNAGDHSQGRYSERSLREISFWGFLRPAQPQTCTVFLVHRRSCGAALALFTGFLEQLCSNRIPEYGHSCAGRHTDISMRICKGESQEKEGKREEEVV